MTKSYIPAENIPVKIDVPIRQSVIANKFKVHQKRGRPVSAKDSISRKRNVQEKNQIKMLKEMIKKIDQLNKNIVVPEELQVFENNEISINYLFSHKLWKRNNIIINNIFAFNVTLDDMQNECNIPLFWENNNM